MSLEVPDDLPNANLPLEDVPELNRLFESYDQAQLSYLRACQEFYVKPSQEAASAVTLTAKVVTSCFGLSVKELMLGGTEGEARITAVGNFILGEDAKRVDFFRNLTNTEDTEVFMYVNSHKEGFLKTLDALILQTDGIDQFKEAISGRFASMLSIDASTMAAYRATVVPQEIPEKATNIPERSKRNRFRALGHHALEVTKISAGVVIGVWAMRRILKD
jgi:hypothetical protein